MAFQRQMRRARFLPIALLWVGITRSKSLVKKQFTVLQSGSRRLALRLSMGPKKPQRYRTNAALQTLTACFRTFIVFR